VVNGTDGDDVITVIARDDSYDPSPTAFRTSCRSTPAAVLYLNADPDRQRAGGVNHRRSGVRPEWGRLGCGPHPRRRSETGRHGGSRRHRHGELHTNGRVGTLDIVNLSSVTTLTRSSTPFTTAGGNDCSRSLAQPWAISSRTCRAAADQRPAVGSLLGVNYRTSTPPRCGRWRRRHRHLTADGTANNDTFSVDGGHVSLAGHLALTRTTTAAGVAGSTATTR
jgi:hypothetical protein